MLGQDRGDNIWISSGGNCISVAKEQLRKAYGTELWIPEDEDIRELTKASENKEGKYYDEKDEAADEPQMDAEDEKSVPMAAYNKVVEEEDDADEQGDAEMGQVEPQIDPEVSTATAPQIAHVTDAVSGDVAAERQAPSAPAVSPLPEPPATYRFHCCILIALA